MLGELDPSTWGTEQRQAAPHERDTVLVWAVPAPRTFGLKPLMPWQFYLSLSFPSRLYVLRRPRGIHQCPAPLVYPQLSGGDGTCRSSVSPVLVFSACSESGHPPLGFRGYSPTS